MTSHKARKSSAKKVGLLGPFSLCGLEYCVRLPTKGEQRGPHPVLCFLHGLGESGKNYPDIRVAARVHGPLSANASRSARRFIVVFPQLPGESGQRVA
jgi:hypothetical protein